VNSEFAGSRLDDVVANLTEEDHIIARLLGVYGRYEAASSVIALVLAREIVSEKLASGAALNSIDISTRFSTSRTPAREALQILEQQGLVVIEPRRQPRIARETPSTISEVYVLRAELYAFLARQVSLNSTEDDVQELRRIISELELLVDLPGDGYFWKNLEFHERLAEAAHNETIKSAIRGLGLRVLRYRHQAMNIPGRQQRLLDDHRRLVLAIGERDAEYAAALNKAIVLRALHRLLGTDTTL
jgi:DNA-binding GntR family transcriptional regulator